MQVREGEGEGEGEGGGEEEEDTVKVKLDVVVVWNKILEALISKPKSKIISLFSLSPSLNTSSHSSIQTSPHPAPLHPIFLNSNFPLNFSEKYIYIYRKEERIRFKIQII